jgi:transmembrane sensor
MGIMKPWRTFDPSVLSPPTDEDRLAREYEVVRKRTLGDPRSAKGRAARGWAGGDWVRWPVGIVAAAAVVALFFFGRRMLLRSPALTESGIVVAHASEQPVRMTLPEGSSVELAPNTRAKMTSLQPKAVRIDVETGRVDVEATHVEGRSFVVGAGPYDVRVTGTRFQVERIPGSRVTVHVDQGVVEVASAGDPMRGARRLGAGEEWSAPDTNPVAPTTAPSEVPSGEPVPSPVPSASAAPAPSSAEPTPAAPAALPRVPAAAVTAPEEGKRDKADKANELFEEAQRARGEGRAIDAARAFDRIRRTYRNDPHAPLAAFELGRLRLDVLQDPMGAEEALHDAMVLGPDSPLREDAEARRVEALSRTGDRAGCSAARGAYLARWPNGTYRRTVELYCSK